MVGKLKHTANCQPSLSGAVAKAVRYFIDAVSHSRDNVTIRRD